MRARRLAPLALLALLTACGPQAPQPLELKTFSTATKAAPTPTCADLAKTYQTAAQKEIRRFDDAMKLAASTARMSLAPQIAELQKIMRDVEAMDVPACAGPTHLLLVESMDSSINGMLAFLQQSDQVLVTAFEDKAAEERATYDAQLASLLAGQESGTRPIVTPAPTAKPSPQP